MRSAHIRHSPYRTLMWLPHTHRTVFTVRALWVFAGIVAIGYAYFAIFSVGTTYYIQREWDRARAISHDERILEEAYVQKLDEMRSSGAALGLVAPLDERFLEMFSFVARAGL